MSYFCKKCGKKYQVKPEKCEICKNTDFSEGCFKRPDNLKVKLL